MNNPFRRPEDTEMIANACSLERMEEAVSKFQRFKTPVPDGIYPVPLQKSWKQPKKYYHVIFQACLRHSYVPSAWKEGTGIIFSKPKRKAILKLNPSL